MDLGSILGAALAGGAQQAGAAADKSLASSQDELQKEDLVKMQTQMDEAKQMRLMDLQQGYNVTNQGNLFAHEDTAQANQQDFTANENVANRQSAQTISAASNATTLAATSMNNRTTLEAQQLSAASSLALAKLEGIGQTVQSDGNGGYSVISHDPQSGAAIAQPLTGLDGKPIQGPKDVGQGALALSQALMTSAKAKMGMGDADGAREDSQKAITILQTNNKDAASIKTAPPQDVKILLSSPPGTKLDVQYDQVYGVGAAAQLRAQATQLAQRTGGTTSNPFGPAPASSGVGLPGSGDPGAGTSAPPLINGQTPTVAGVTQQPSAQLPAGLINNASVQSPVQGDAPADIAGPIGQSAAPSMFVPRNAGGTLPPAVAPQVMPPQSFNYRGPGVAPGQPLINTQMGQ